MDDFELFDPIILNMSIYEIEGEYKLVMEYTGFSSAEEATHCGHSQAEAMVMVRTGLHSMSEVIH